MKIVQTAEDLAALQASDAPAYRAQLVSILGSSVIASNTAAYPDDYDSALEPGQDGYVAPIWVSADDTSTLARFGFQRREQVEEAIAEAGEQSGGAL